MESILKIVIGVEVFGVDFFVIRIVVYDLFVFINFVKRVWE